MSRLEQLFQQFLRERTYINNITTSTRVWYECAWKAFTAAQKVAPERTRNGPLISKTDLQQFIVHLRERGVKPVTCNTWLRAMNAFCRWLHEQDELPVAVKLAPQRLEKRIIRTHDDVALRAIITYKPKTFPHWRVYALVATILDTGCRIDEALNARVTDFDLDNLLLIVDGKGRKERRVPFSFELRKVLFRFGQFKERSDVTSYLMFPAREGGKWEQRNALRSYYCFLKRLGLPQCGFHLLRHTFATQYLRAGGDVVRLSIILLSTRVGRYRSLVFVRSPPTDVAAGQMITHVHDENPRTNSSAQSRSSGMVGSRFRCRRTRSDRHRRPFAHHVAQLER